MEEDLNVVLRRLFKLRIRLGYFDLNGPLQTIGMNQVCSPYAIELARDGARQGMVLLKNTGVLPLKAPSAYMRPVVIGPNVDLGDTIDYYAGALREYSSCVNALGTLFPCTLCIVECV